MWLNLFILYIKDERYNLAGNGLCLNDCECDGLRTCVNGKCSGNARNECTVNSNKVLQKGEFLTIFFHKNITNKHRNTSAKHPKNKQKTQ